MNSAYILLILAMSATAAPVEDPQLLTAPQADYLPPDSNYLPPETAEIVVETTAIPEFIANEPPLVTKNVETITVQEVPEKLPLETAVLNDDGYAYKTVRQIRLRYRARRDVSHLNLAYLPPSQEYLPPLEDAAATEQPEAATPKINLDYLPPTEQQALTASDEAQEAVEPVATEATVAETEAPQDTAVLAADGYHYKQPEVAADLSSVVTVTPVTREYLPPIVATTEAVVTEQEQPGGKSEVLTDAGYRYKAVKRFRY